THASAQTGQTYSKSGFDLKSGQADAASQRLLAADPLTLLAIHAHIVSQLFEVAGFEAVTHNLLASLDHLHQQFRFISNALNLRARFRVSYTKQHDPLPPEPLPQTIATPSKTPNQAFHRLPPA
ncbi:diaminopimelate decarboxylase, partial [Lacticaseibacillus rhamnosus]